MLKIIKITKRVLKIMFLIKMYIITMLQNMFYVYDDAKLINTNLL